jgi:hypothetical protein
MNLCNAGLFRSVAIELVKYNLGLMEVQSTKWDEGSNEPVDDYTVCTLNENRLKASMYGVPRIFEPKTGGDDGEN